MPDPGRRFRARPATKALLAWVLGLVFAALPVMPADESGKTPGPAEIIRQLGHGINLADALEAPVEGQWGVTLREDYFTLIRQAGFGMVRVPIRWSAHAAPAPPYQVEPEFWARIDWVVAQAETNRLQVILDFQNYDGLIADPAGHEERFLAIWGQIAEHFRNAPPSVLFELLNEPHQQLDAARWNSLLARAIQVIRPSNPARLIVVGPVEWNKISSLPALILPEEDRLLVATVHYYDPMTFTHQGAPWEKTSQTWLGNQWLGTVAERRALDHDFDLASAWASAHGRPLLLGEFGTFEMAPAESRVRWTRSVARAAEARGMAWNYWEFCGNFGAYDPVSNRWRMPLLRALRPE